MQSVIARDMARRLLLEDLCRAGVTDATAEESHIFTAPLKVVSENVMTPPLAAAKPTTPRASSVREPASSLPASLRVAAPPPVPSRPLAWLLGQPAPVLVALYGAAGEAPLPVAAQELLNRMLACVGLAPESVCRLVVAEDLRLNPGDAGLQSLAVPQLKQLLAETSPRFILALGQGVAGLLLGEAATFADLRQQPRTVGDAPLVTTYPPQILLSQPTLKRLAWRDLLTLEVLMRKI